VAQGQFELTGRVFRDRGFDRDPLGVAGCIKVAEERVEIVQLAQAVDLDIPRPVAGDGRGRDPQFAVRPTLVVDQKELQLAGDDRGQVELLEPVDHATQDVARIVDARAVVKFIDAEQHLRECGAKPRRAHQGSRDRLAQVVGVAVGPDQAAFLHILAGDVERQHGAGQVARMLVDRQQIVAAQVLAARHAALVGEDDLDGVDVRVLGQEFLGLGDIGNKCTHDFSSPREFRWPAR
jgi:hypothetical protein